MFINILGKNFDIKKRQFNNNGEYETNLTEFEKIGDVEMMMTPHSKSSSDVLEEEKVNLLDDERER